MESEMTKSEQSRKDALADAETLRNIVGAYGPDSFSLSYAICPPLKYAHDEKHAAYFAVWAARHAFHVVPALKE